MATLLTRTPYFMVKDRHGNLQNVHRDRRQISPRRTKPCRPSDPAKAPTSRAYCFCTAACRHLHRLAPSATTAICHPHIGRVGNWFRRWNHAALRTRRCTPGRRHHRPRPHDPIYRKRPSYNRGRSNSLTSAGIIVCVCLASPAPLVCAASPDAVGGTMRDQRGVFRRSGSGHNS